MIDFLPIEVAIKLHIPSKTFLLGEYAAMVDGPAIILTTTPCFTLSTSREPGLHGIDKNSPAARFWAVCGDSQIGLDWYDPYHGRGGLGASSAQFLSLYRARQIMLNLPESAADLLEQYWLFAWSGKGFRPSGYDVLAQSSGRCVVIEGGGVCTKSMAWPFPTLGFLLLHTGQKLATHTHLQTLSDISAMNALVSLAAQACVAFETYDSALFIEMVNVYHTHLLHMGLVAPYTERCINALIEREDVLAAKGCGAMGADVLLVLTPISRLDRLQHALRAEGWEILATAADLYDTPTKNRNQEKNLLF